MRGVCPLAPTNQGFWIKADVRGPDDCWPWLGYINRDGYGIYWLGHRPHVRAHRHAYQLVVGLIREGLELDHLCRNRACINPTHLEAVTHRENVRRGKTGQGQKRKTHCIRGHALTVANTYVQPNGKRRCRTCRSMVKHRAGVRRQPVGTDRLGS